MRVDENSILNKTSLDHVLGENHTVIKTLLLIYNVVVILLGLGGNSLVLFGSLKYHAIQMDTDSVILLENIAVADICATILQFIPMLVTLAAERWLLGKFLCFCAILRYIPFCGEAMLIAIMSCHRVRVLRSPLQGSVDPALLKKLLLGIWVFYITSLTCITGIKPTIRYEPSHLHCSPFDWENTDQISSYLRALRLVSAVYLFLPAIITVIANVMILYYADKNNSSAASTTSFKAVKTVSLICWVYIASYVPSVVLFALPVMGGSSIPHWVNCMNMYIISFNIVCNPIIYSFTNRKFAIFAKLFFTGQTKNFQRQINLSSNPPVHKDTTNSQSREHAAYISAVAETKIY